MAFVLTVPWPTAPCTHPFPLHPRAECGMPWLVWGDFSYSTSGETEPGMPSVGLPGLGAPGCTPRPQMRDMGWGTPGHTPLLQLGDIWLYARAPGRCRGWRASPDGTGGCSRECSARLFWGAVGCTFSMSVLGCSGVQWGAAGGVQRVRDSSTTRHRIPACLPSPWQPPGNQR